MATAAYQPEPVAAAAARRFVRDTLRSWPLTGRPARRETLIDDAVLLTSELVTNAVVHARTCVQVTCKLSPGTLEIVVLDQQPAQIIPDRPQIPADPAERTSGRGLQLPAELASAWGVTYAQAAKAVWFRLSVPGRGAGRRKGMRSGAALAGAAIGPAESAGAPERLSAAVSPGAGGEPIPARASVPADDVPAWARRKLRRLGYEELLAAAADAVRGAVAADIAYLLDAGEDGELRVRAVAGTGESWLGPGAALGPAATALAGAAGSLLTVPLLVDGRVTGLLAVAAADPGRFSPQQGVRLRELADQYAPALEQARLSELERSRQDRAAVLAGAGEELSSTLSEEKIAAIGARIGAAVIAHWCAIFVGDDAGRLRLRGAAHADTTASGALEWLLRQAGPPPASAADWPGRRGAGWRWQLELPAANGPGRPRAGLAELTAEPAWCFPLQAAAGAVGLLVIGGPGVHWPARQARELAAGLARRVAVALECASGQAGGQARTAAPRAGG